MTTATRRLMLACSYVHMEASNLPEAQASASHASAALKGVERQPEGSSLHPLCSWMSVRALLMQGRDEEACRVASSEAAASPQVRAAASHGRLGSCGGPHRSRFPTLAPP